MMCVFHEKMIFAKDSIIPYFSMCQKTNFILKAPAFVMIPKTVDKKNKKNL